MTPVKQYNGRTNISYVLRGKVMPLEMIAAGLYFDDVDAFMAEARASNLTVQEFINSEADRLDECERQSQKLIEELRAKRERREKEAEARRFMTGLAGTVGRWPE